MKKHASIGIVGGMVLAGALVGAAQGAPVEAKGDIESVTLYRGQALVTRAVVLNAPVGAVQLVVTDLPERVQAESLYASAEKGAQVRAVRYRAHQVGQVPRAEVQKLDDQIKAVESAMRKNAQTAKTLRQQQSYLTKLQNFVAPTAQVELTRGVLKTDQLTGLTEFIFEQVTKFSHEELALNEERSQLQEQLRGLQRKRSALSTSHVKEKREALVFLDKTEAGRSVVRLSYLVEGASWSPSYNLRAGKEMKDVQVEYNAIIRQMSGEDWNAAALTLSTASPNLVGEAPALAPFLVAVSTKPVKPSYGGYASGPALTEQRDRSSMVESNWQMNVISSGQQGVEVSGATKDAHLLRQALSEEDSALSVNYKLEGKVSLASRADQQIVRIADLKLPAEFCNVAVPLLTERVYRQAEVTNSADVSLLEGQCSCYLNGDFVGKSVLPIVATGQRFKVGFGSDAQLRVWREFISRDEKIQGGNKEVTFRYRLVLDNYKDKPVAVRAFDRMPYAGNEIRVTVGEMSDPLSKDKEYLRAFRPNGILRWDLEVPAKSAATTARILDYEYRLEFDRDRYVVPAEEAQMKASPRMLMEMQFKAQ